MIFTPVNSPGGIILFDMAVNEPVKLILSFSPDLKPMWPAGMGGQYAFWNEDVKGIIISESRRKYNAIIGCPLGEKASSTPAHQLPGGKISFEIPVSPEIAKNHYIPVVISGNSEGREDAITKYNFLKENIRKLYEENESYYEGLLYSTAYVNTPDKNLNKAFMWAKTGVDNGLIDNPDLGTGLVAGFGLSAERERPGFAWFFGGDAFYNLFAVNSVGNFSFTKTALEFLRENQRNDGKMMHELSQGAGFIKWFEEYPYGYYHADTTPLYIIAVADYIKASGDLAFLKKSWESVKKAYQYIRSADTDNDGLMENSVAGLGASELGSLREGLKVGVYLSAVSVESYRALNYLSQILNNEDLIKETSRLFNRGRESINRLFYDTKTRMIPFGISMKDKLKNDITVWPAVGLIFNLFDEKIGERTLSSFSEYHLCSDWGTRMLSSESPYYEPLAYNNGAVWPFLTGYVTMAEYNNERVYAGFNHLKQIANNTFQYGLGNFNELFSGEFFRPVSTSVQHQLFSISPILTNTVRGVFGTTGDFINKTIEISPRLPASWDFAHLKNFKIGDVKFNIIVKKGENLLKISLDCSENVKFQGIFKPVFGLFSRITDVRFNGKSVKFIMKNIRQGISCEFEHVLEQKNEIEISYMPGFEIFPVYIPPEKGDQNKHLKVVDFFHENRRIILHLQGVRNHEYYLKLKSGKKIKNISGAGIEETDGLIYKIRVLFTEGDSGYINKMIEFEL